MTTKPWYLSKALWLNAGLILTAIITAVLQHQDIIGPDVTAVLTIILSVLGVLNRIFSENPPLTWK